MLTKPKPRYPVTIEELRIRIANLPRLFDYRLTGWDREWMKRCGILSEGKD